MQSLNLLTDAGNAKIGQIHKDKMAEQRLRQGDLTVVPAGSAFYLINDCSNQQLQIIASIDSSDVGFSSFQVIIDPISNFIHFHNLFSVKIVFTKISVLWFQSFFISGGHYPASVLSGFDPSTIISAFNVSYLN